MRGSVPKTEGTNPLASVNQQLQVVTRDGYSLNSI